MRHVLSSTVLVALGWFTLATAATIDPGIVANPESVQLDRSSTGRWQALFRANPAWISRQIAYLETRQADIRLSLLMARLLYRGEPWTRRDNDTVGAWRWRQDTLEARQAILRSLRAYREPIVADHLCHYLTLEDEPSLVISALVTLALIDPTTAQTWAYRLADPRTPSHLPGSASSSVRQEALEFLIETRGLDAEETKAALDWALLRVSGAERNRALHLLDPGAAPELIASTVLRLAQEYRTGVADPLGKQGLVLAIGNLRGYVRGDVVQALMELVVNGERAVAITAASALATTLQWDVPVAINDLMERATKDPDAVVRQSLTAFLLRLDPASVVAIAPPNSP
ncbi:MAG TPA: hypothetical protein VHX44_00780, partial [Planctomycetota bacterium]|nr:hypothetical protein [Planctomycetota bacterium]